MATTSAPSSSGWLFAGHRACAELSACTGADPWRGEPIAVDPARISLAALHPAFAEFATLRTTPSDKLAGCEPTIFADRDPSAIQVC